jgi:hypothetical protein
VGAVSRIWAATAVLAAGASAAAFLAGGGGPARSLAPTATLSVHASFDPSLVQFGDRFVGRVVVLLDRHAVDASRLRVQDDLAPLSQLGPPRVSRTARGRPLVVTVDVPAACLAEQCLANKGPRLLRLPAVRVEAPRRGGGLAAAGTRWPVLEVRSRVSAADQARVRPPFRSDVAPPAIDYRISPSPLALLLEIAAAVLAAAGFALAGWQAAALHRSHGQRADRRSEIERALALAREAERRPTADRRRALGLLARLLGTRDAQLAGAAQELAWSEPAPTPDALAALVIQVEREVDGR